MVAPAYSLPGAFPSITSNFCSHPTKYKACPHFKDTESEALRNEGALLELECYYGWESLTILSLLQSQNPDF